MTESASAPAAPQPNPALVTFDAGNLLHEAMDVARELRTARAVSAVEPDTGTEAVIIIDTDGNVKPMPASYFDDYRSGPKRIKGTSLHTRLESFIEHVNKFKSAPSVLFAVDDMKSPSLTAVLNYNIETSQSPFGDRPSAGFSNHRSVFNFPLSEEWKVWTKHNNVKMDKGEFAQFLDDHFIHVEHVDDPSALNDDLRKLLSNNGAAGALGSPSKLVALSRELEVHERSVLVDSRKLGDGTGEIRFKTEQTGPDGAPLNVPTVFILNIPIFAQGDIYRIGARLRFRPNGGHIQFWYELWGLERVFELAFAEACERATTETELPLFFGSPE